MSQPLPGDVRLEPYDRTKHGDGPAQVVEDVFREFGFTWEPGGYHHDVLHPEEAYAPPEGFFEVAVEGVEVIGTVGGIHRDGVAELRRLYLRESARGKGVGRRLLDRFLAWAEANRCERAIIWSDKRFTDAHRLYGKAGFQVMADRVADDPDHSPEYGYRLELPAAGVPPAGPPA